MAGSYGQDWASYQPDEPDTTGLAFAIVKVTEGTGYVNPRWVKQRDHAKASGLTWGGYHYPHMGNDPRVEADRFLAQVAWQPGDIVVLDWEGYDDANKSVSAARQVSYKEAWLRYVKSKLPHNPVGMYCNVDYWERVDTTGYYGDFLWIATSGRAAGDPGIKAQWMFHQYSAAGVDRDYCPLNPGELHAWALSFANPPTPIEEDPLPFTEDDLRRFIREETASPAVRDMHAYAGLYWLHKALTNTLPQGATGYPWEPFLPQIHAALAQLPPDALAQLQAAVTAAMAQTVNVHVTVDTPTQP